EQLLADDAVDSRGISQDRPQLADPLLQVGVLVLDPLALEAGESAQPQVQDRLRLDLREPEALLELRTRVVRVVGAADQRDDLVEVVEGDEVPLEHMCTLDGLAQLELRTSGDDLALVVEVVLDELEQRERTRHTVDEGDGVVP